MLPAHGALLCILSKSHWPRNDAGVAKHMIIVAQSTVIRYKKTAENNTANSFWIYFKLQLK